MNIRHFAAMTGLAPSSVRYYERRGLLSSRRLQNGYRAFGPEDAFQVNSFRMLTASGFSVQEAIGLMAEPHDDAGFADALRNRQQQLRRQVALMQRRTQRVERTLRALDGPRAPSCAMVEVGPYLAVRASHGMDFEVSLENRRAIEALYELMGMSACCRIIDRAALEARTAAVQPSYVIAIPVCDAGWLPDEARRAAELLRLGRCVRFQRAVTRAEGKEGSSFAPLHRFLDARGLRLRDDAFVMPFFLNLDGRGLDIEVVYAPVEEAPER
ncbi:MerR family transcriptional regulator [Berryella wangjianweii]|uniref:MerR family transcriptional regulator n=1 Tax=Berryella wangjianweii TaxID=2734634 RepID=A0A6M8J6A7_9ACTN|nr:MerR family transcriptional regulator [Berryella wangjianweii]QKF07228.1 MerR family transcriptional regulator [Berryella wangjianweii]